VKARPSNNTFDGEIRDEVRAMETRTRAFPTIVVALSGMLKAAFATKRALSICRWKFQNLLPTTSNLQDSILF